MKHWGEKTSHTHTHTIRFAGDWHAVLITLRSHGDSESLQIRVKRKDFFLAHLQFRIYSHLTAHIFKDCPRNRHMTIIALLAVSSWLSLANAFSEWVVFFLWLSRAQFPQWGSFYYKKVGKSHLVYLCCLGTDCLATSVSGELRGISAHRRPPSHNTSSPRTRGEDSLFTIFNGGLKRLLAAASRLFTVPMVAAKVQQVSRGRERLPAGELRAPPSRSVKRPRPADFWRDERDPTA